MTTEEKIIKNKLGLIKLATTLGNVSSACKVMGYSRDSFYRFKELYDKSGELALQEISRKKPCIRNRVEDHIEKAVVDFAIEKPAYGQLRASNELKKKGIFISPGGVRSVWLRHDLETFQKRLKALEAKMAQENLILTEEQLRALEKAKDEKESHGEIESLGTPVTWVPRTLTTWVHSKVSAESISRHSSTPIPRLLSSSSTTARTPWWPLTFSMTVSFRGTRNMMSGCYVF